MRLLKRDEKKKISRITCRFVGSYICARSALNLTRVFFWLFFTSSPQASRHPVSKLNRTSSK